jgi:hypothetical protein
MPSLVPLSAFATKIFAKIHADISERVNVLRFANLVPTFSKRAWPELRRFVSLLSHGAFAFFASDPSRTGRLGELRGKFPKYYDAEFRIAVCHIVGIFVLNHQSPLVLSASAKNTVIPRPFHSYLPHCFLLLAISQLCGVD